MLAMSHLQSFAAWGGLLLSLLMVLGYEVHAHRASRRDPTHQARFVNARMRQAWVQAMCTQPGFEIVAVQALRNALMSATVAASTAALVLMASVTLGGASIAAGLTQLNAASLSALHVLLGVGAVALLFASYVCAAMSMRYYGNATLVMSLPVNSPQRQQLNPLAEDYVQRAGLLYGWALRMFFLMVPAVAGVVHPYALVPATVGVLVGLHFFDRPTAIELG
jgi:uncharacterized membrane protein